MQMVPESVRQKLGFARARLANLEALIKENRLGSEADTRQQLTQEFFFHLVGATEYLAQLINQRRSFQLRPEDVTVRKVAKKLDPSDPLLVLLKGLLADPRKAFPADPYSEEGLIYNAGPFFYLDPRDKGRDKSTRPVDEDLRSMFSVVDERCCRVLEILG